MWGHYGESNHLISPGELQRALQRTFHWFVALQMSRSWLEGKVGKVRRRRGNRAQSLEPMVVRGLPGHAGHLTVVQKAPRAKGIMFKYD